MSQHSVWRVKFHLELISGKGVTAGPYTTFVGISGGTRGDGQNSSTAASVQTAVTNNLTNILKTICNSQLTGAPGGTVVIDSFDPASVPELWE